MRSMKRRNHSKSKPTAPPADLLVCFPARAHLTLLPSPARAPAEPHRRHHRKAQPSHSQPSPLPWAKEMASEPTSPKVTCAGQIKIRPQAHRSTKNWQSVMEEIERIHNKKKLPNIRNQNPLGFKGEIVNFLSCLRGFRFDFSCFRGFHQSDITSEDEEEEEEEEFEPEPESESDSDQEGSSRRGRRTMFSNWFMVLQEEETKPTKNNDVVSSLEFQSSSVSVPPPNALLLMRCRSAPNSLLRKPKQEAEEEQEQEKAEGKQSKISLKLLMEEEKEVAVAKKKSLMVMDYDADFYKLSSDIAKETWVVSGSSTTSRCNDDPLVRSRSWKR